MPPRRRLALLAALAVALLLPLAATAQHRHAHDHKPRHGGLLREAAGFVYELKVTPASIEVWVTDEEDRPVPVRGSTAVVTLVDSGTRVPVTLVPGDGNRHAAAGSFPARPGTTAMLEVAVGGKNVARLRYTLK